jgi:hypothetical protein
VNRSVYENWMVNLAAGIASRDAYVVQFDAGNRRSIAVAFVAGRACSLEEQCLIAGEATSAILKAIGDAGDGPGGAAASDGPQCHPE